MVACVNNVKNNYIATAKAIGIFLMVLGHIGLSDYIIRYIYMFHMPLFFFCSGYFFKKTDSFSSVRSYTVRRIRGLYLPYVKWAFLFLCFHNIFYKVGLYSHEEFQYYNLKEFFDRLLHLVISMTGQEQLLDPFWFLKQLFLSSLLINFLFYSFRKFSKKRIPELLCMGTIGFTVVSKYYGWGLPVIWDLSIIFLSATFFLMGYIYHQVERISLYRLEYLLFSLVILGIFVYLYGKSLDMLWYNTGSVIMYVFFAPFGIFATLCISFLIDKYKISKVLHYIGNHTMPILALHLLAFKTVNFLIIKINGLPISHLSDFKVIEEYSNFFFLFYLMAGLILPLIIDAVSNYFRTYISNIIYH